MAFYQLNTRMFPQKSKRYLMTSNWTANTGITLKIYEK